MCRLDLRKAVAFKWLLTSLSPLGSVTSIGGTVAKSLNKRAAAIFALSRSPAKEAALPREREVTTTAINTLKEEGEL